MQLLWSMLSIGALLMAGSAVADRDGYMCNGGVCRMQSNNNVNLNLNVTRMVSWQNYNLQGFAFITTTIQGNVFVNGTNHQQDNFNVSVQRQFVAFDWSPVPHALTRKTTIQASGNFTNAFMANLNTTSQAVAFPFAIEYNETDGQAGFQYPNDTMLQVFKFNNFFFNGLFNPPTLTITQQNTSTIYSATACNNRGFCFSFFVSNGTYTRNGVTYAPDAVKVDFNATDLQGQGVKNTSNIALVSVLRQTADLAQFVDYHKKVDAAMQQALQTGQPALVTPDFVASFNAGNTANSAYLNFARTANLTTGAGVVTSSSVNAELVGNKSAAISALDNDPTTQLQFNDLRNTQYIVFSFLSQVGNNNVLTWDPDMGITDLQMSAAGNAGLSGGAIAGIVIGVVVVAGLIVGGAVIYHKRHAKSSKKGLLG